MLFDAKFEQPWANIPRENRIIFIGKNLDRFELTNAFRACIV